MPKHVLRFMLVHDSNPIEFNSRLFDQRSCLIKSVFTIMRYIILKHQESSGLEDDIDGNDLPQSFFVAVVEEGVRGSSKRAKFMSKLGKVFTFSLSLASLGSSTSWAASIVSGYVAHMKRMWMYPQFKVKKHNVLNPSADNHYI